MERKERNQHETPPEGYKINPLYIEKRNARIQLLITESLSKTLKAEAKKLNISVNELINKAINEFLKKLAKE